MAQPKAKSEEPKTIATQAAVQPIQKQIGTFEEQFGNKQLETSFRALTQQQQQQLGGFEGFRGQVETARTINPLTNQSLDRPTNQDVAIGTVLQSIPRAQEETRTMVGPEQGQEFVDKSMEDIARTRQRQEEFQRQEAPPPPTLPAPQATQETDPSLTAQIQTGNQAIDSVFQQSFGLLETMRATGNTRTVAKIEEIQRTFQRLRDQAITANTNRMAGLEIIGSRTGRQRFAPEIQSSILGAEERAGLQRLAELDAQELSFIQQAEQANEDNQFRLLSEQMNLIREARREKEDQIDRLFQRSLQLENLALAKAEESREAQRFAREGKVFNREQAQIKVENLLLGEVPLIDPETGAANISAQEKVDIERNIGLSPGTFDTYYQNLLGAQQAIAEGDTVKADIQRINALRDIPEDVTVTIGGEEYSGLKPIPPTTPDKPITVGNPKTGVWERDPNGQWRQVVAPTEDPQALSPTEQRELAEKKNKENAQINSATREFEQKLRELNNLVTNKALSDIVGPNTFLRFITTNPVEWLVETGDRQKFLATIDQLVNTETVDTLQDAIAGGATFGALSESELDLIKDSATKLNSWINRDGDGNAKSISTTEKNFLEEVGILRDNTIDALVRANGFDGIEGLQLFIGEDFEEVMEIQGGLVKTTKTARKVVEGTADLKEYLELFPSDVEIADELRGVGTEQDIVDFLREQRGFSTDLSRSVNGSTQGAERLTNGRTALNIGSGTITGIEGSSAWKHGLDFVLEGGKGAPVPSPVSGTVIASRFNGGFGNQVKIRTDDGQEVWVSHLDDTGVKEGQRITQGKIIGKQGNTGTVLGGRGEGLTRSQIASGRGTHLDITMKKPDGSFYKPREVAALLGDRRLS